MNTITLGVRNAFRNLVRSTSIIVILGISIGLTLTMLIAHQAVGQKISDVKSSVGNTITISPAGYNGMSQANNALTTSELAKVKSISHITNLTETLTDRLTTTGSTQPTSPFGNASSNSNATTNLKSPVKLNSNKGGGGARLFISGGSGNIPSNFSLPISVLGTTGPSSDSGSTIKIKSGKTIDGTKDSNDALVSTDMAGKNSLKVGSTFKAYGKILTVAGIFDSGTKGGNDAVIISLPALQRLSGQSGAVTSATATVDSLDNLAAATSTVKSTLSDADIQSSQDQANETVKPLENIQNISLVSLIGAVVAGAVIILLTMIMIVRERRREIGILKAIGASNTRVIFQFMSESVTLTLAGAIIGIIIGVAAANPITNMLVSSSNNSSSTNQASSTTGTMPRSQFMDGNSNSGSSRTFQRPTGGFASRNVGSLHNTLSNIQANVGWSILAYGFGAAILIAIIGSSLAGWLIAKVRPSEVMRAE